MFKKRTEIFDGNFVYFIILSLFVVLRIVSATFEISEVAGYIFNFVFQVGLAFCLPIFLFSYLQKQKVKQTLNLYGFKKINVKSVAISLIIGILVYIVTIFVSSFFSAIISYICIKSSPYKLSLPKPNGKSSPRVTVLIMSPSVIATVKSEEQNSAITCLQTPQGENI